MLLRTLATVVAAGRVASGAGLALAPRAIGTAWIGSDARHGSTQAVLRGFAVRDIVLGLGGLRSLGGADADSVRAWAAAQGASDAADLVSALLAGRSLSPPVKVAVVATAAGAAAINFAVAVGGADATGR